MKILFVGLGSIGTRHLKNFHTVSKKMGIEIEVHALRSSNRQLPQDTIKLLSKEISSFEEAEHYDVAFITNPTNLHFDAITALSDKVDSFFIEKPIFEDTKRSVKECNLENKKAYIAAPMRWCKTYMELKKHIENIECYSARVICSSYLPEWRKDVDYRNIYSAKRDMGGGVTIDLIHEWDYLVDLFGKPEESFNFKGTYSHLEIDSDDLSIYIARYKNMLAEIHLDYFGRKYRRTIELFTKDGTIEADFGTGVLTLANGEKLDYSEDVNERYIREMEYFLSYIQSDEVRSINSPTLANDTLALTLGE